MANIKVRELLDLLPPQESVDLFVKYDDERIAGRVMDILPALPSKVLDSEVHYIRRTDAALEITSIEK